MSITTAQTVRRTEGLRRLAIWVLPATLAASIAAVVFARYAILGNDSRVHAVADAPARKVALILGCSPRLQNGLENWYFRNRIECAADLFKAGRAQFLLVSGDNSRKDYDEPTAMRDALVARGVPSDRIFLDYAGFSTLDSVVRAREVFGESTLTIVSQRDHVLRALYIADARGLDTIGVAAADVSPMVSLRTDVRESLARVRTLLDVHLLDRQPHFFGPRIEISLNNTPVGTKPAAQ